MLNFLKKAIQDPAFSDGIRHGELLSSSYYFYRLAWDQQFYTILLYFLYSCLCMFNRFISCYLKICTFHYGNVNVCMSYFIFIFFSQVMDGSLPTSLKHIISNAEYYGPSLFLLGEFTVTLQESPSSTLLTVLRALTWFQRCKICHIKMCVSRRRGLCVTLFYC